MKSVPDQLLSKFSPHAMLDYLFQHFYSTLAIVAFFIAILILRACGKRGRRPSAAWPSWSSFSC